MIERWKVDSPKGVLNPYWEAVRVIPGYDIDIRLYDKWSPESFPFKALKSGGEVKNDRHEMVRKWAWAIPSPDVLALIVRTLNGQGVVEIGAGTGYWAWQLTQLGVSVVAYDHEPPDQGNNYYHGRRDTFYPVIKATAEVAGAHPDRALFLCWPPYDEPMAADALRAYQGNTVIYIGEGSSGCTGDEEFHNMLEKEWDTPKGGACPMVQWWGLHDWITIYHRKGDQ